MQKTGSTLYDIILYAGEGLDSLGKCFADASQIKDLFSQLGWNLNLDKTAADNIAALSGTTFSKVSQELIDLIKALRAETIDWTQTGKEVVELGTAIMPVYEGIKGIIDAVNAGSDLVHNPNWNSDVFFRELCDLITMYLIRTLNKRVYHTFLLLGIFDIEDIDYSNAAESIKSVRVNYQRHIVYYERISLLFSDQKKLFRDAYGWGSAHFRGDKLFNHFGQFLQAFGCKASAGTLSSAFETKILSTAYDPNKKMPQLFIDMCDSFLDSGISAGLSLFQVRSSNAANTNSGLGISPFVKGSFTREFQAAENWLFSVAVQFNMEGMLVVTKRPSEPWNVKGSAVPQGSLQFTLKHKRGDNKDIPLLSLSDKTGIFCKELALSLGAAYDGKDFSPLFSAAISGGSVRIKIDSDSDGLIGSLLASVPEIELLFDLTVGYSESKGLFIDGGAGLTKKIDIRKELGPFFINTLTASVKADSSSVSLTAALTGGLEIGPVQMVIHNVGIAVKVLWGDSSGSKLLGKADLAIDFKSPDGFGISFEVAVFKASGFLSIEEKRYIGMIEISVANSFSLLALGVLTEENRTYSFLILINTYFPSPIALGMNFYLNAVGGMVGYNRGMDPEAMRAGVRAGTMENVMFPKDPLKNLPKIIDTMESYYPFCKDQFIFGPFCQITWSIPALIKLNIGLLIELPDPVRIAIIGTLSAKLPKEDAAILSLNAAFMGLLDFKAQMLSFDASIYDSYLGYGSLKFSIEGDIIFRLSWGKRKAFVYSMGGFHPAFKVPNDLAIPANIKRMTITIWKDNPKLVLTHYFAITSNTVQFGGALDFLYKKWGFSVEGGLWLDTLFQFNPFMFIVDMGARLAVKCGSTNICSVGLGMTLSGPNPWNAKGYAKFSIWIFSYKVSFDKTFGEEKSIPLEESTVLPKFFEALNDKANWKSSASASSTGGILISVYKSDDAAPVIDSSGFVQVDQQVIPLDFTMNRFGTTIPKDVEKVKVTDVWIGKRKTQASADTVSSSYDDTMSYLTTEFAKSQFSAMSEKEKLSAPSYEPMKSGIRIQDNDQNEEYRGLETLYNMSYEQIVCDEPDMQATAIGNGIKKLSDNLSRLAAAGCISRSGASLKRKKNPPETLKPKSMTPAESGLSKASAWEKRMMNAVAKGVR